MAALDPQKVAEIRRLAAEGATAYRIAKTVGVSPSSVQRYAPPGSFDRSKTAAAVKAHKLDAAGRRAAVSERVLAVMEQLADRMGAEHLAFGWYGKDGDYHEKTLDLPPAAEMRQFAGAFSSLATTHMRLEQFNLGDEHQDARDAIISFGDAVREMVRDEAPEPE